MLIGIRGKERVRFRYTMTSRIGRLIFTNLKLFHCNAFLD